MNDELEHFGIKGMKWGIRRTAEQLGRIVSRPKMTPNEKWKTKKINAINRVYNKTYRQLDTAAKENPDDKSIIRYKRQLQKQQKKDISGISEMTYMQIRGAKAKEAAARTEKVGKAIDSVASGALWTAKMALTLTRIGGMALMVDIAANAGSTVLSYLDTPEGRTTVRTGAKVIDMLGRDTLQTMAVAQNKLNSAYPGLGLPTGGLNDVLRRSARINT